MAWLNAPFGPGTDIQDWNFIFQFYQAIRERQKAIVTGPCQWPPPDSPPEGIFPGVIESISDSSGTITLTPVQPYGWQEPLCNGVLESLNYEVLIELTDTDPYTAIRSDVALLIAVESGATPPNVITFPDLAFVNAVTAKFIDSIESLGGANFWLLRTNYLWQTDRIPTKPNASEAWIGTVGNDPQGNTLGVLDSSKANGFIGQPTDPLENDAAVAWKPKQFAGNDCLVFDGGGTLYRLPVNTNTSNVLCLGSTGTAAITQTATFSLIGTASAGTSYSLSLKNSSGSTTYDTVSYTAISGDTNATILKNLAANWQTDTTAAGWGIASASPTSITITRFPCDTDTRFYITPTNLTAGASQLPTLIKSVTVSGAFDIVASGAKAMPGRKGGYIHQWYDGATGGAAAHMPDDSVGSMLVPVEGDGSPPNNWNEYSSYSYACTAYSHHGFDNDIAPDGSDQTFDCTCGTDGLHINPDLFKTLRGLQNAVLGFGEQYVDPTWNGGPFPPLYLTPAYLFYLAQINAYKCTAAYNGADSVTVSGYAGPDGPVAWTLLNADGSFNGSNTFTIDNNGNEPDTIEAGVLNGPNIDSSGPLGPTGTIYITPGWDRYYPQEVPYLYPKTCWIPDLNGGGIAADPAALVNYAMDGSLGVGQWQYRGPSETYKTADPLTGNISMEWAPEEGSFTPTFGNGDIARYVGDNAGDGDQIGIGSQADAYAWSNFYRGQLSPANEALRDKKTGSAAFATTYSLTDPTQHWLTDGLNGGVARYQAGTATSGSATTLGDSSSSSGAPAAWWNRFVGMGQWQGFALEIFTGGLPSFITAATDGTGTVSQQQDVYTPAGTIATGNIFTLTVHDPELGTSGVVLAALTITVGATATVAAVCAALINTWNQNAICAAIATASGTTTVILTAITGGAAFFVAPSATGSATFTRTSGGASPCTAYNKVFVAGGASGVLTFSATPGPAVSSGDGYLIREPKYELNKWQARTATIKIPVTGSTTPTTLTLPILGNDDSTLFFAAASFTTAQRDALNKGGVGWQYAINEIACGSVLQWNSSTKLWAVATGSDPRGGSFVKNPTGNLPRVIKGFGQSVIGDYVNGVNYEQLRLCLNLMYKVRGGGSWNVTDTENCFVVIPVGDGPYHECAFDGPCESDWNYLWANLLGSPTYSPGPSTSPPQATITSGTAEIPAIGCVCGTTCAIDGSGLSAGLSYFTGNIGGCYITNQHRSVPVTTYVRATYACDDPPGPGLEFIAPGPLQLNQYVKISTNNTDATGGFVSSVVGSISPPNPPTYPGCPSGYCGGYSINDAFVISDFSALFNFFG